MKSHARFGPSTLDNLSKCPRFKYQETEDVETAASEGTLLHHAVETGSLAGLDEEQRLAVTSILGYIGSLLSTEGGADNWLDRKEMRLELQDLTFGTADRVLIHQSKPVAHILDAKFGRLAADHDFQVQTYAAALVELKKSLKEPLETVTTHVLAPRQQLIEERTYNAEELLTDVRARIEALYEHIDDPFNPPTPHEDLCARCARAARCPAMGQLIVAAAPKIGLPLPAAFAPDAMVSVRDRGIAQVLAGAFQTWGEQVKQNNTAFVSAGGTIPGYKLVKRSTGLRVPSDMTSVALTVLEHAGGVPRDVLENSCNLVIGRLIKNYAGCKGVDEGEAKEQVRKALDDIADEGTSEFLQKTKRITDAQQLELLNQ